MDKARERNDEGHREVASILQSPADWLTEGHQAHPHAEERMPKVEEAVEEEDEMPKLEEDERPAGILKK